MDMMTWAEKEVAIACARERAESGTEESEWDYGCACYESALKALKSLGKDGHSGMSMSFTKSILMRLIDGKPLTPIEDTNDIWEDCRFEDRDYKTYQCKRMSSLFKYVYPDGTVKYHDTERIVCVDTNNAGVAYYNGFVSELIHEMFPIEMPYIPESKPYKVYVENILSDLKNGDWDTMYIRSVLTPDGNERDIKRFFKFDENGVVEINVDEYVTRAEKAMKLKGERKACCV